MRDDRLRLADMRAALVAIERYVSADEERFMEQELVQVWTLHHHLLLGEAARGISPEFREQHPTVPWSQVIGLRNIFVHQYFNVDPREVWAIVERDLPGLRAALDAVD